MRSFLLCVSDGFLGVCDPCLNRPPRPGHELLTTFQDVGRYLEIIDRQGAPGFFVNERPHSSFDITRAALLVSFEIEPSVHQDAKETVRLIQTVTAEHRPGPHLRERTELVEDELME